MANFNFTVTSETGTSPSDLTGLNNVLAAIDLGGADSAVNNSYTITLGANIALTQDMLAINLASGATLTLAGGSHIVDGGNAFRGFLVHAGSVVFQDLTIQNARAQGGAGGSGLAAAGGGGGGLGGGLFLYRDTTATLQGVSFVNDSAFGGAGGNASGTVIAGGGYGGGGGMGGGGAIYVDITARLTLEADALSGGSISGSAIAGGAAGVGTGTATPAQAGVATGAGILIRGTETIHIATLAGITTVLNDEIGGTIGPTGVVVSGGGTLSLGATNSFSGGLTIKSGTIVLAAAGAAGTGPIAFVPIADPVLEFSVANLPTNRISGFGAGDFLRIDGKTITADAYTPGSGGGVLKLTFSDSTTADLNFTGSYTTASFVLSGGPQIGAVRHRLLARAAALGHAVTDAPEVHLRLGARVLWPLAAGSTHRFRMPQAARGVRLVSRSFVPVRMYPESGDHRRLGVAIAAITADGRNIGLDEPRLGSGWHRNEPDVAGAGGWRWTDGDAALALSGVSELVVEVAMSGCYWHTASRPARRPTRASV